MLGKNKLNIIEVLISKSLKDSYMSHGEFVSINNVLIEYNDMNKETKKFWTFYGIYYMKTVKSNCVSCKKNT